MAIVQHEHHQHQSQSLSLDALFYCEEDQLEADEEDEEEGIEEEEGNIGTNPFLPPPCLLQQDLFWEDEELLSLFSKEQEIPNPDFHNVETEYSVLTLIRREAVEWILNVNTHYGFTALTAMLAINYLDRFLCSRQFQGEKPWMIQLAAVTCLSLAAKVEETQVPLLLDLQVEGAKYVFEAKTIQRMELLVLSTLGWRMNPVTPISFLDHITRRLGLKTHLHWEFFRRCERLLLCVAVDWRFVGYMPSVLAAATLLHVIHEIEPFNSLEYQNQLLGVLKINKEKVNDCYQLIAERYSSNCLYGEQSNDLLNLKRKHNQQQQSHPNSPSCVIDTIFSPDCSNESWAAAAEVGSSVISSSPPPPEPLFKKRRGQEQRRAFLVDVCSPP